MCVLRRGLSANVLLRQWLPAQKRAWRKSARARRVAWEAGGSPSSAEEAHGIEEAPTLLGDDFLQRSTLLGDDLLQRSSENGSAFVGVRLNGSGQRCSAEKNIKSGNIYIGTFDTPLQAASAGHDAGMVTQRAVEANIAVDRDMDRGEHALLVGVRVEVQYQEGLFMGTVISAGPGLITVTFDNGDKETLRYPDPDIAVLSSQGLGESNAEGVMGDREDVRKHAYPNVTPQPAPPRGKVGLQQVSQTASLEGDMAVDAALDGDMAVDAALDGDMAVDAALPGDELLERSNNCSGFRGVDIFRDKWMAQRWVNGTKLFVGTFDTPLQAP